MADDPRVQHLLDELLDSQATPEEVCSSCPELLPVVRARWREMRCLQANLDALFPLSDEPPKQPYGEPALPQIPGYRIEGGQLAAREGNGGSGSGQAQRHGLSQTPAGASDQCPPAGEPSASPTIRSATSAPATGWNRKPAGAGSTGSRDVCLATISISSWNWVARNVVHGRPDASMTSSAARFEPK